jgi:hypothetical protein
MSPAIWDWLVEVVVLVLLVVLLQVIMLEMVEMVFSGLLIYNTMVEVLVVVWSHQSVENQLDQEDRVVVRMEFGGDQLTYQVYLEQIIQVVVEVVVAPKQMNITQRLVATAVPA